MQSDSAGRAARFSLVRELYENEWGIRFAVVGWGFGLFGVCAFFVGVVLLNWKILVFGVFAVSLFTPGFFALSKLDRAFWVSAVLISIVNTLSIVLALVYIEMIWFIIAPAVLTAIWGGYYSSVYEQAFVKFP